MIDYYQVLEVQPTASPEVIQKAYKALCLKHHPDHHHRDRAAATRKMQQINEAFAVLSDPLRRRAYDQTYLHREATRERQAQLVDVFLDDGLVGLFRAWLAEQ